jgi:hypothetical protein
VQILTQPTESIALLQRYRAGDLAPRRGEKRARRLQLVPTAWRGGAGLALGANF